MYHHTATENPYCLRGAKTNWTPTPARMSYKFSFVRLSIQSVCNARSLDHQLFLYFFHKVLHHKVRKVADPRFWKKKGLDWLGFEVSKSLKNGPNKRFLGFWENLIHLDVFYFSTKVRMIFWLFAKTTCLVLEFWSKNLKTNQNAGSFKLQYLTNKLRYEIDFLDMTKGLWKQQILVCFFKWVW